MRILTKKRIHFKLNYELGKKHEDRKDFTSKGGLNIEDAPDWISKDPYFAMVRKDGDLQIIGSGDKPIKEKKSKDN